MTIEDVDHIAVLGAGTMGHGIAEVAAIAGYSVALRDIEEELVSEGYEQIEWSLGKLVEHDRLSQEAADATLGRIDPVVPIEDAVADADVVIEAVPERMEIKREVFAEVIEHAPENTIFTSNTSGLSITDIADVTDRPERFCGMHFFNPPIRMDLVEVISGADTNEDTLELVEALAEDMGKTPVRVEKDRPGFVVNRILIALMNEAAWIVHTDEASMEAVDATGTFELGLPMGAVELADQVGLDVALDILEYIHSELGDAYEPCPLIAEKVEAGALGKKTDRGFYEYENGGPSLSQDARSEDLADRMVAILANEVAKLLEDEVATIDVIDTAVTLGAAFPEGPATMADGRGLDSLVEHLEARYEVTGAERYAVCDELRARAADGGFRGSEESVEASFDALQVDVPRERVGRITIDREHRMNAVNPAVLEELPEAVELLEEMEDIRAILVTGAGDRAFSAGADIGGMASVWGDVEQAVHLSRKGQEAFGRLQDTELPVIAAVDGYCLGGGMELATAADMRIASERSTFAQPERDLGLLPGWGGTQRLIPIVGMGRAKEIVFTGDQYDAETMAEYGFVNRVVTGDALQDAALDLAEDIAAGPPIAMGYAKRAMNLAVQSEDAGLAVEASAFGQLTDTDDLSEGVTAFLEDREPEFTGS